METSKKITNFLGHPIVQLLGFSGVLAVITWIVTHMKHLPPWEIWLAVIFSVGCALWIINQFDIWRERHKKWLTKFSDEEVDKTVREWLDGTGVSIKRLETLTGFFFRFAATDPTGRPILVVRATNDPSRLVVSTSLFVASVPEKNIIISEDMLVEIANNISLEMARLGISFHVTGDGTGKRVVNLYDSILLHDSLTVLDFQSHLTFVTRGFVLCQQVMAQTLRKYGINLPVFHKEGSQT